MSGNTITLASIKPAMTYIDTNWITNENDFLKKHVLARGAYLLLAPASLITTALDTIVGLGAVVGAILTLGQYKPIADFGCSQLEMANILFVFPYASFLKAVNPEAIGASNVKIFGSDGLVRLIHVARSCQQSDNFLKKHVASRLTYALTALACLVVRAVAAVISIPITALSLLTVGKFHSINNLACSTLMATGIINDLFMCTLLVINPAVNERV